MSNIRRKLNDDELLFDRDRNDELEYEQLFLGGCYGVALTKRGRRDSHICFVLLVEDDCHWFPSANGGSSFWLEDAINVMQAAFDWCKENADFDKFEMGWKFR